MASLLSQFKQKIMGQQQQQPPANPPANPMQQAAIIGLTPPNQQGAAKESTLDQLQFFMDNKDKGQQAVQTPSFAIPPEELAKIVNGQDFTKNIPPEAMQRLMSGDMTALPEVLNAVGRSSYQSALSHNMALTDKFVASRFEHEQSNIHGLVDQRLTNRNLDASIQHLHPYAQKMFKDMAADFRKQFPNASEQDIQDTTWEAYKEIGAQSNNDPASVEARKQVEKAQPNWDEFADFSSDSSDTTTAQPAQSGPQGFQ